MVAPFLALITPLSSASGSVDPGYGVPGGGHPAPPIFHPGHPDHGLPSTPGHPSGGFPVAPALPGHGLPWAPGHPSGGFPIAPALPGQGLPWAPGHPDAGLPTQPGHPSTGLPGSPGHPSGQPIVPGVTPYGSAVATAPPDNVDAVNGAWVLVNVQGSLVWAWAQKPAAAPPAAGTKPTPPDASNKPVPPVTATPKT